VTVVWSPRALRELRSQRRFIARTRPAAAATIVERIIGVTDRLETYPHYGRVATWDVTGRFRELSVPGTPFIILYTIDAGTVLIDRLVHGAQLREPE
jgi:plasmid stabilization system protein ParE